jgi:hypothetical protein
MRTIISLPIRTSPLARCLLVWGILLLSGCGGDSGAITNPWLSPQSLVFAYPYPGQQEVPAGARVVLRFSGPMDAAVADEIGERLQLVKVAGDDAVAFSHEIVDDGRGVLLRPAGDLLANTEYRLKLSEAGLGSINAAVFNDFRFRTAGDQSGSSGAIGDGIFRLLAVSPLDQSALLADIEDASQPNDMSTLRMAFSRVLDPASVNYGNQVRLLDQQGQLVEAVLLLQGRYLVLDPKQDLHSQEYTLSLSGLRSRQGEVLAAIERAFTPVLTLPRETAVLKVGTIGELQPELASRLTGQTLNEVPVQTFVLGDKSFTRLEGDLAADLGFVPDFPDAVPLRVPAGSVLRGSPVDVNILGEVNSAIETGEVLITLLSDANGYLIENPFSASPGAPRYALLDMDAAMTAEGTIANAALSQNLLNIQVVGLAIVEDGILVMDAVAVVEPEILGLERANGLLSFRLEAYADQRNAPVPPADTRPLALQSWSPGEQFQPNARPGDPIILNFNKPLDAGSVFLDGAIQIRADGMLVSDELAPMRHDGATVIIDGSNLQHNIDIDIDITSLLRDTQGNPLSQDQTLSLRLDDLFLPGGSAANLRAPLAAVFPGFSCALTGAILTGERDTWRNGRCVGGNNSDPLFHVDNLYKDYPIRVLFSRSIDPATINENTLFVERRDESNSWVPEPGRLDIQPQRVDFFPDTPWQIGALYRYTLRSVPNNPDCGVNAICTPDGAPLQTRQISQSSNTAPASREGGPNMVNHFVAAGEADRYTLVGLRALPVADVNGNATMDDAEQGAVVLPGGGVEAPPNHLRLRLKSTGGVITNANLGCEIGQSCPEKRFAFISSGALAAGPRIYDPDVTVNRRLLDGNPATDDVATGAIEADIFPTIVTTTSVFLEARALGLIDIGLDTGPLILRLVPQQATQTVIPGFISDTEDGPWFNTTFDVLVDAPELEPRLIIELGHDIRSKRVTNVTLEGPLRFVDDGRLILKISNPDPLIIPANINLLGIGLASVELEVPSLALDMTLTFLPVKDF